MIDRIELILLHQPVKVRELHGNHTVRLEQLFHSCHEIIQLRHVRQYIVPEQQISLSIFRHDLPGRLLSEESHRGRNSLFNRHLRHVRRRLYAEHRYSMLHKMLQQIAIVAGNLHGQTC